MTYTILPSSKLNSKENRSSSRHRAWSQHNSIYIQGFSAYCDSVALLQGEENPWWTCESSRNQQFAATSEENLYYSQ